MKKCHKVICLRPTHYCVAVQVNLPRQDVLELVSRGGDSVLVQLRVRGSTPLSSELAPDEAIEISASQVYKFRDQVFYSEQAADQFAMRIPVLQVSHCHVITATSSLPRH